MVNYKDSQFRAKETVTFRLTSYEKQLLGFLASEHQMTQTALIRSMLAERAERLGISTLPPPIQKRRPGRPKLNPVEIEEVDIDKIEEDIDTDGRILVSQHVFPQTFGALIVAFQRHFEVRGEKMQLELEETVRFVTGMLSKRVFISKDLSLSEIDNAFLNGVRDQIKDANLRFPQKNLHLTYLRMMFNFAVKEGKLGQEIQPMEVFRSFTAKEVADAFPLPVKTI